MIPRTPVNRALARTVIEFLRYDVRPDPRCFAKYSERDWRRTKVWLDSSGLALYFLDRLQRLQLQGSIPKSILDELEQNRRDRDVEVQQRFELFGSLLQLFQQHQISFAVEKGIALTPEYCPDISFRFQGDFDFFVSAGDIEQCQKLLQENGYRYVPTIEGERRFYKGDLRIPSMREFYKPKQKHTVELHFEDSDCARAKLSSAVLHQVGSLAFPVLSRSDCFVEYVLHFVKHLRGGWARADTFLEYRRFVNSDEDDQDFWAQVQRKAAVNQGLREAIAITALLAQELLGFRIVPGFEVFVSALPAGVRRWVDRYGSKILLSEFPGTKVYLILQLESGRLSWWSRIRSILPATYRPSRIAESDGTVASNRQALMTQTSFFLARCWYHLSQSVRLCYELLVWRWSEW